MRNGSESDMCFHGPCIQHARVLSRLVIEMVTNSPPAKSSISGECILCILACVNMALAVGPSPASSTPIRPPRVWSPRGPTPTGIQHKPLRIPTGIWNLGEESEILSEVESYKER